MSEENFSNPRPKKLPKGLSIAGMVLGICGCVLSIVTFTLWFGLILSVIGAIISAFSIKNCNDGKADEKEMAIAGFTTSIVGIGWCIYIIVAVCTSPELYQSIRELDRLFK